MKKSKFINKFIGKTCKKGLDLIGMKTVYFNEENLKEFSQTFEKSRFFEVNQAFLVFAFSGKDAILSKKLKNSIKNYFFLKKSTKLLVVTTFF